MSFCFVLSQVIWVPAAVDTRSWATYISQRVLEVFYPGGTNLSNELRIKIGAWSGSASITLQHCVGHDISDVNIIGMNVLVDTFLPFVDRHLQTIFTAQLLAVDPNWPSLRSETAYMLWPPSSLASHPWRESSSTWHWRGFLAPLLGPCPRRRSSPSSKSR